MVGGVGHDSPSKGSRFHVRRIDRNSFPELLPKALQMQVEDPLRVVTSVRFPSMGPLFKSFRPTTNGVNEIYIYIYARVVIWHKARILASTYINNSFFQVCIMPPGVCMPPQKKNITKNTEPVVLGANLLSPSLYIYITYIYIYYI